MKTQTKFGLVVLLTAAGVTGVAWAQGGPRDRGLGGVNFETLDRSGDGVLTVDDIEMATDARFAEMDANGDGDVTQEEFSAAMAAEAQSRAERIFARLDADGDGLLSQDVFEARRAGGTGRIERLISRFDEDGDGGLSEAEFETARAEMRAQGGPGMRRNR